MRSPGKDVVGRERRAPKPVVRWPLKAGGVLALVVGLAAVAGLVGQDRDAEREKREPVGKVLAALRLEPGQRVADIGAGDGFYTERIARAIAPTGRVTAVDISETALARLRQRVAAARLTNVDVVLGEPADPGLEAETYDAALIYNSYHEMIEYRSMLQHTRSALKPGGWLVMADSIHDKNRSLPREQQVASHELASTIAAEELVAEQFEVREKDESFTRFANAGNAGGFWLIVAIRPR